METVDFPMVRQKRILMRLRIENLTDNERSDM